jgi:UDP-glucuronate decarboxylase
VQDDPRSARYLVTGAAGFIGSHLCEALLRRGHRVVGVADLSRDPRANVAAFARHPSFSLRDAGPCDTLDPGGPLDGVFHVIPPTPAASSIDAGAHRLPPRPTGVDQAAALAARRGCRLLVVGAAGAGYEDPFTNDPCADAVERLRADRLRVARVLDTYGPRMEPEDQPLLMRLLLQASTGQPMLAPDGCDPVSACFVSDLVNGLLRLFRSDAGAAPVELGDPREHPVDEVVAILRSLARPDANPGPTAAAGTTATPCPVDLIGWAPRVPLAEGLHSTWAWLLRTLGPTVGAPGARLSA